MSAVTNFVEIAPRRRGKAAATVAMINAAIEILEEIHPASVRAVCYRLFVAGLIPNMSKSSTDKVSRHLVDAREAGHLPWDWIVDETREAERIPSWNQPAEIFRAAVRQYRKDYWSEQPNWLEVWSEKGTVRGTLAPVLEKYGVTFRVMHGYSSATSLHSIAEETITGDKLLHVLYVGDWDCSGLHMSEVDIPGRLDRYAACAETRRVALTEDDIGDGLPSFDAETKAKDPRYRWFRDRYGVRCWELDAMSPVDLRRRVESEILFYLDVEAWEHCVRLEAAERDSMRDFVDAWQSKSRLASDCSGGGK